MIARFLLPLLAFAIPRAFAQPNFYGPVTVHLKAGDRAPDIVFKNLLNAPVSSSWSQSNLSGQTTVLVFFLDTSHNIQQVDRWNALIDKFAGKPFQFIWITDEEDSTLLPFLIQHPVKGWVFHDPAGQTGKAYGLAEPVSVFIGPDRKIIGFQHSFVPTETLLNAVQEGRITTTRPNKETLKAFIDSKQVLLDAEPPRMFLPDNHKPNFPPSYELHVSLSKGEDRGNYGGDSFRSLRDYTLKEAIQDVYNDINPTRIHLPESLNNDKHYDLSLVLPAPESRENMNKRFQQGIQTYFHLTATRENRQQAVYVVTVLPNHKPPALNPQTNDAMGFIGASSVEFQAIARPGEEVSGALKPVSVTAIRGISLDGTAEDFCHTLEAQLDRPVINETNLRGQFNFHVEDTRSEKNDFLQRLRDQTGLIITPSQRVVETLVFEPR
jgi:uncharacterized protein (TIGR03435 family)